LRRGLAPSPRRLSPVACGRILREEFGARGERVLTRRRNVRVDGLDVDLLVETDKAAHVEVKDKPADAK